MISEETEDTFATVGIQPFGFCWSCGQDLYFDMGDECECFHLARDWDLNVPASKEYTENALDSEIPPRLPPNYMILSTSENTVIYQESPDSTKEEVYCAYIF